MAIGDTLKGDLSFAYTFQLARAAAAGRLAGNDTLIHTMTQSFIDGAGAGAATCFLSGTGTSTVAAITLSLADFANPLSTFSNEIPTADPDGLKVRLFIIHNLDATNFITVAPGVNAWPDIGTNKIRPGGWFIWMAPAGGSAIVDGASDELTISADTAPCLAEIHAVYG